MDLFIPAPTRLLWEAFLSRNNYARRLFTHISTTVYNQVLIYTAESTGALRREWKCSNFEMVAKGIRTRLSRLRVRHSTPETPHSTIIMFSFTPIHFRLSKLCSQRHERFALWLSHSNVHSYVQHLRRGYWAVIPWYPLQHACDNRTETHTL